jgi:hypothetical protein
VPREADWRNETSSGFVSRFFCLASSHEFHDRLLSATRYHDLIQLVCRFFATLACGLVQEGGRCEIPMASTSTLSGVPHMMTFGLG